MRDLITLDIFSISHLGVDVAPHMPIDCALANKELSISCSLSIRCEFGLTLRHSLNSIFPFELFLPLTKKRRSCEAANLRKHHQIAAGITNRPARKPRTTGYFARPKERYYLIARYTRTDLGTDCRTLIMSQRPPYRRQVINPVCHVRPEAP